jgi:hypothetical protein
MTAARLRDLMARRALSFTDCDGRCAQLREASAIISPSLRSCPSLVG